MLWRDYQLHKSPEPSEEEAKTERIPIKTQINRLKENSKSKSNKIYELEQKIADIIMATESQNNNSNNEKSNGSTESGNGHQTLSSDLSKEMQQYYMGIVKRKVHDNSSYYKVWKNYATGNEKNKEARFKIDFNDFDDTFLRLYKDRYKLNNLEDNYTLNGFLLQTELGSKTSSFKKNNKSKFVPKPIVSNDTVKEDLTSKDITPEEANPTNGSLSNSQSKYQTQKEKEKNKMNQIKENLNSTVIRGNRTSRYKLVGEIEAHFKDKYQVKEAEAISQFVYKVKKNNKKFKLEF